MKLNANYKGSPENAVSIDEIPYFVEIFQFISNFWSETQTNEVQKGQILTLN